MKFSLISATSIFALFSAAVGPAHAAVLTAAPGQTDIYDLVHDGLTSSDGGDSTVTRQDSSVSAVMALEAATVNWQGTSFTGPVDPAAAVVSAVPRTPPWGGPGHTAGRRLRHAGYGGVAMERFAKGARGWHGPDRPADRYHR